MNSENTFCTTSLGTTVRFLISDFDMVQGGSRSVLEVVMSVTEDDFYRLQMFE